MVAIVSTPAGFTEACAASDLVVSLVPAAGACAVPVIDPASLARDGAYAVWLAPSGIRLLSVHAQQGDRPWTPASEEAPAEVDQ